MITAFSYPEVLKEDQDEFERRKDISFRLNLVSAKVAAKCMDGDIKLLHPDQVVADEVLVVSHRSSASLTGIARFVIALPPREAMELLDDADEDLDLFAFGLIRSGAPIHPRTALDTVMLTEKSKAVIAEMLAHHDHWKD